MAEPARLIDTCVAPNLDFPAEDFSRYRLADLYQELHLLKHQQGAIDYRLACVLREIDQRETVDGRPLHLATWFAHTFGVGYGTAREKVRTARALQSLPAIDAAFREGKLSYSKVRALTRVAHRDNEARLIDIGSRYGTGEVERVVQRMKQQECLDDVQAMLAARSLTHAWSEDGSLIVRAKLTPEQGAIWLKALEKAEAALESEDEFQRRHADALTQALEDSLNDTPRAGSTGDRYQVVVHVSAETLAQVPASDSPVIENGPHLHPETARRLACDASLVALLENGAGNVLDIGRKTRVIPASMRRALQARDQHCRFPGCSHTKYVDGHHIVHWSKGGETKLDNLVLLCRRHHRTVHEMGFRIVRSDGGFEFETPP